MNKPMPSVRRKATNISLDSGLLEEARALQINISRACERGLADQISEAREQQWRADNADALASSNHHVADQGLPLAGFRRF
ncbi:type II toxin-antitoxin system CcdA family antitoxin [Sphingobium sp. SA2]|uniref:type II toxin-antitoxin system CcdA family antitoxin n=1 Tax=Sphingobium sp. SA2 TaxID=1524832 RepID=UPI0028C2E5E0|nr:type II toxin-antitoxin system CcdA family antitoxin [Sphingobium sp. SA2]MDT7536393.1 type II toxin-antitoxin system CcdA family antitoxin [Sphingobium sp. SA2]